MSMTKRQQLLKSMREMEDGMWDTATADHVSQIDVKGLLWAICKAVFLLLEKELKK